MSQDENSVLSFIESYPEAVQDLVAGLRLMILSTIPAVDEILDRSARIISYGFGTGYRDMVCTIIPSKQGVKLGIVDGTKLSDE